MAPKKSKTQEKTSNNKSTIDVNKHVLVRDLGNKILLIIRYNDIVVNQNSKIGIGKEVSYVGPDRVRGRGQILIIGTEQECTELMDVLEKTESTKNKSNSDASLIIDDAEENFDESEDEEQDEMTTNDKVNTTIEKNVESNKNKFMNNISNKTSSQNNKRALPLTSKNLISTDENRSPVKRTKYENDSSEYLRGRILVLQDEISKYKKTIDEMKTKWMPRPDQVTVNYFAKVVSIYAGEDDYEDDKGEKLEKIKTILALSEDELNECYDPKSIRNTCRQIVRLVFKKELADSDTAFGQILKDAKFKKVITAIRDYGRLMHPVASDQFTNGELNNAMGSDFYQRDRNLRLNSEHGNQGGDNIDASEEDY